MKIMMFAPYSYPVPGGQETHIYGLMRGLEKKGIDVDIITRYEFSKSKASTLLFYFKSILNLPRNGYDIIHGHDIHVGAVMSVHNAFSKIPSILTVHSSIFLETYKKYPWFYSKMFKSQKALVGTSRELSDKTESLSNVPSYYIPNGVDTNLFKPYKDRFLRDLLDIPTSDSIILTTRRLDRKNNVIELARAFNSFSKKTDSTLVIVGDGEQRKSIESLENPKIHITGFIKNDKIPRYLNGADIFVMSSLYEATSISCLEAMSCGLPIVVTNVGGLPELVDGNGTICSPTARSIEHAMEKVLNDDTKKMALKSRKIAEKYSWDKITEHYLKLYKGIL